MCFTTVYGRTFFMITQESLHSSMQATAALLYYDDADIQGQEGTLQFMCSMKLSSTTVSGKSAAAD